jgi:hypothetical protein
MVKKGCAKQMMKHARAVEVNDNDKEKEERTRFLGTANLLRESVDKVHQSDNGRMFGVPDLLAH